MRIRRITDCPEILRKGPTMNDIPGRSYPEVPRKFSGQMASGRSAFFFFFFDVWRGDRLHGSRNPSVLLGVRWRAARFLFCCVFAKPGRKLIWSQTPDRFIGIDPGREPAHALGSFGAQKVAFGS